VHVQVPSNISLHTKFVLPSFTHSKYMVGPKNGSRDSDHAHLRVACHPTNAWHSLSVYKIWRL